jgi:hypothetical protein
VGRSVMLKHTRALHVIVMRLEALYGISENHDKIHLGKCLMNPLVVVDVNVTGCLVTILENSLLLGKMPEIPVDSLIEILMAGEKMHLAPAIGQKDGGVAVQIPPEGTGSALHSSDNHEVWTMVTGRRGFLRLE